MQNRIAVVLGFFFVVSGCRVVEPAPPPDAPRIGSFTASKTRIAPGEEVTLTFTTTGATKVELSDDSGNAIQLDGAVEAGTAKVAPTRSAFYVLRATGAGGRDSAFVQIAVNEPLRDVFLIAVPAAIDSGAQGQLLWGAAGASSVTLKTGAGTPAALTGTTGTVTVSPVSTEQYTLSAQGAPGTPPLTAIAEIQVRPVIKTATLTSANAVQAGETLSFAWTTAGAARVTVSEQTFGQLSDVTEPSSVANGTFDYVLPAKLPNGIDVSDGLPLRFIVSATAGNVTVTRLLTTVVGDRPVIEQLTAPEFASAGRTFTVAWKTLNATQITINVGGLPVFQTLAGAQARVDQGSIALPVPSAQTEYTLVATNDSGASVQRIFNVRPVAVPVISTYTLTPTLNALGDPATARWTTMNAVRLQLRFENGATLAVVTTPSQVNAGNVVLTPATGGRVVLEAYNAAGDVVTDVKTITFAGGAVTVNPTPVVRGATAVLSWTLSPISVLETVGLATPAGAPIPNSPNFIDLSQATAAQELTVADPTDGAEKLTPPAGFRFPLLGQVRPELWVSVNGFIAFANPGASAANSDISLAANAAPTLLAPFWDDLTMGMNSKVFYSLLTATSGERYLVVQWDKFQIAGAATSELTFQVQLYETGQVTFIYKTVTGTLSSATIGVKDAAYPLAQQYSFNSTTINPSPDLELNFFTGGPADGMLNIVAGRSKRIEFFGRTATGLVPASAELRSFGPGDVSVSEAMPFPEASVATLGQWVELQNNADVAVDFDGLLVDSTGSTVDGGYVIPSGTIVPAGGFLVLGQSTNTSDTSGATVNQIATDLPLGASDRVRVQLQGTVLGTLSWDGGVAGTSIMGGSGVLVASGQTFACTRMTTFGPAGAYGTPGTKNESCAPYAVTSIPGAFVNAPPGTEILTSISSDDGYGAGTLPVPFTYFGAPQTAFGLSTNGFMTLGYTLSGSYLSNDSAVSTSAPNGVLALFWDDLVRDTGKNAMWRQGDRTIITWENFRMIGTSATDTHINAQIHLLDSGVIEFHYGTVSTTLTTQSTIDRVFGNSATVWLERPDGVIAVPWRINQLNGVVPNSGLRFTPVP